jgi:hypothetical protein
MFALGLFFTNIEYFTENEPLPDQVQALCEEVINKDVLPLLADSLFRLDFEVWRPQF